MCGVSPEISNDTVPSNPTWVYHLIHYERNSEQVTWEVKYGESAIETFLSYAENIFSPPETCAGAACDGRGGGGGGTWWWCQMGEMGACDQGWPPSSNNAEHDIALPPSAVACALEMRGGL